MTGGCERIAACRLMNVQRQSERTEARGESVRAAGSRRRRRASRSNQGEGEAEGRTLELVEMAAQRIRLRDEPGVYDRWDRHTAACALHHRAHRKHRATNALQVKAVQQKGRAVDSCYRGGEALTERVCAQLRTPMELMYNPWTAMVRDAPSSLTAIRSHPHPLTLTSVQ